MKYILSKPLPNQIQALFSKGGGFQKAAEEIKRIIGDINLGAENPFKGIPITKNGEARIKHCIKYDLTSYARLITIQENDICILLFTGTHDECDRWLTNNKGFNVGVDLKTGELLNVMISDDITNENKRISDDSDYSEGKLYSKLKDHYFDKINHSIPFNFIKPFLQFESFTTEDDICNACLLIPDENLQNVFFDVFMSLKKGDVDAAKNRILEFEEKLTLIENATESEIESIVSNDQYLKIDELEAEYIKTILENKDFYDWMLFLHPNQKEVVNKNYTGSARLLGVSGSGKTCVLVHRSLRLAKKYPGEKILILTLNQSLAKLIYNLIELLCKQDDSANLINSIEVKSFWELSKELLIEYDEHPLRERIFSHKTDILNETIEEIWDEYYTCKNNNSDAEIMLPLHTSLLSQKLYPSNYIKQEFDWIRSAFSSDERQEYLAIIREGRSIPFLEQIRTLVLEGLAGWDNKMNDVGVIDYLGLANALYKHLQKIKPIYRCILVDEVQDFGTIELKIIRHLAPSKENDIFLSGDIAQQVYTKHHKLKSAGINIIPNSFAKILKNYRNSREILEAAFSILKNNSSEENYKSDDFEILSPEYANYSSPKPFIRSAKSLNAEFNFAYKYLLEHNSSSHKEKSCIAICGYSLFDIADIAHELSLPVLDGEMDLSQGEIFLSDLEQTKGFEFDRVVIINCNNLVIPNPNLPKDEWYREISKLYVAMTRAKKELVISYSEKLSDIFESSVDLFTKQTWDMHFNKPIEISISLPKPTIIYTEKGKLKSMTGKQFLYTIEAIGITRELQGKLIDLVAGSNVEERGKRIGWKNIRELNDDLKRTNRDLPTLNRIFGPIVFNELELLFQRLFNLEN